MTRITAKALAAVAFAALFAAACSAQTSESVSPSAAKDRGAKDNAGAPSSTLEKIDVKPETAKGEKSRAEFRSNGRILRVEVAYTNGRQLIEQYRKTDGTLESTAETDFKGWKRNREFDGKGTRTRESVERYSEPESVTVWRANGEIEITWYGYANGNREAVDKIDKAGNVSRQHYTFDGQPSAQSVGKRKEFPDGSVEVTWFEKGVCHKTELFKPDETVKVTLYEKDGKTKSGSFTYDAPRIGWQGNYIANEYYKNGLMTCQNYTRADKGMDMFAYAADGKTPLYKQDWRYEARKQNDGRVTNFLLARIEEYDATGKLQRELIFSQDGKKVREVREYAAGMVQTKWFLRDDAKQRVDGTVERIEHYKNGKLDRTETRTAADNETIKIDSKRLLDPHFHEDEPGKIRIRF
jgi:uncharacterized protein YodC (DUF2158 family)